MTVSSSTGSSPYLCESKAILSPISTISPSVNLTQSLNRMPVLSLNGLNTTGKRKISAVLTTTQSSANALKSPIAAFLAIKTLSMTEETTLAETSFARAVVTAALASVEQHKKSKTSERITSKKTVGAVLKAKPKTDETIKITEKKLRWNDDAIKSMVEANPKGDETVKKWIERIKRKYNAHTGEDRSWDAVDQKVRIVLQKRSAHKSSGNRPVSVKKTSLCKKIPVSKKSNPSTQSSCAPNRSHSKPKMVPCLRPQQSAESIGLDLNILNKMIKAHEWDVCNETRSNWLRRIVSSYNETSGGELSYCQIVPYINDIVWPRMPVETPPFPPSSPAEDLFTPPSSIEDLLLPDVVNQTTELSSVISDSSKVFHISQDYTESLVDGDSQVLDLCCFTETPFTPFL